MGAHPSNLRVGKSFRKSAILNLECIFNFVVLSYIWIEHAAINWIDNIKFWFWCDPWCLIVNSVRSELCTLFFIYYILLFLFYRVFCIHSHETLPFYIFGQCTHILCIQYTYCILNRKLRTEEERKIGFKWVYCIYHKINTVKPLKVLLQRHPLWLTTSNGKKSLTKWKINSIDPIKFPELVTFVSFHWIVVGLFRRRKFLFLH